MGDDEQTIELAGMPIVVRRVETSGTPPLYLHDLLASGREFAPFLARTGGIAPDLIGFGRSAKAGNLDYSLSGHADFIASLLDELEVDTVQLVAHGWGAGGGLMFAQRHPGRVERLVVCNALPLLPGFAPGRLGRALRMRGIGELVMGSITRRLLARGLRRGAVSESAWSEAEIDAVWENFDQGTQRATLRLVRDAAPERLEAAGAGLAELRAPALVMWGEQDPWLPVELGEAYAQRLPQARLERIAGAGHWPWRDQPEVIERVAEFLA